MFKATSDTRARIQYVREKLLNDNLLTTLGYEFYEELEEQDPLAGDSYIFVFINRDAKRLLKFYFTPEYKGDSFIISSVTNMGNGEVLSIPQYLKCKNVYSDDSAPFKLNSYAGNFYEQINGFLNFMNEQLSLYMGNILGGQAWEQVPFDWGGYK